MDTIKLGPETWVQALPLLLIAFKDATPQGQKQARKELENIARVADLVPDLIEALKDIVNHNGLGDCTPNLHDLGPFEEPIKVSEHLAPKLEKAKELLNKINQ